MADSAPVSSSTDPTLYLYTSLTAGSSHIITATSRLETILKVNKIPFRAVDVATDEKARMLWGRRSKGRKLPGLVKYGMVVGDLDQIEEWNEYGELKEQIGATTEMSYTPIPTSAAASLPVPRSDPPSRSSSETRHISISEPKDAHDSNSPTNVKKEDTPLTMAMRQAGVEAALKASQSKGKSTEPSSTKQITFQETDLTTPSIDPKLSKASEDPDSSTEMTAAKTPSQLASEGARRTSVEKIAESESGSDSEAIPGAKSTEEQLLQLRRSSSVTKTKSKLSEEVDPLEVVDTPASRNPEPEEESKTEPAQPPPIEMRRHRGSSISSASKEEIAEVERRNTIVEVSDEDEDSEVAVQDAKDTSPSATEGAQMKATSNTPTELQSTDEEEQFSGEEEASSTANKAKKITQEQDPKDESAAGVSVED